MPFYKFRKEPMRYFMNPDLTNKSWIVHIFCTLVACEDGCNSFPQKPGSVINVKSRLARVRAKSCLIISLRELKRTSQKSELHTR